MVTAAKYILLAVLTAGNGSQKNKPLQKGLPAVITDIKNFMGSSGCFITAVYTDQR